MSTLVESDLRRALAGASISTRALQHDPATAELRLERADRNGDGQITDREIGVLAAALDRLDGRRDRRMRLGASSTSREALLAVANLAGSDELVDRASHGRNGRDTVLFVGVTRGSIREARALREHAPVRLIREVGTDVHEQVQLSDGRQMPLRTPDEREAFVRELSLPIGVQGRVLQVLDEVQVEGRGELAALAQEWASAYHERGPVAERLVFSGHGDGAAVFEQHGDGFERSDILALARAMPAAAMRIRHIHIAACQHGYESRMTPYFEVFPALQSVFGYAGFAPGGGNAIQHQTRWERRSRVDYDGARVERSMAQGTRRAVSVAVLRQDEAWQGPNVEPLGVLDLHLREDREAFERLFSGEDRVRDPGVGFAAEHYQTLQSLTAHHDFADQSESYRAHFIERREQTLRLRFFDSHIARSFERAYGSRLQRGYTALGLQRPNFARLNRAQAVRAVQEFQAAFEREGRPRDAASAERLLDEGLLQLDPSHIPVRWL